MLTPKTRLAVAVLGIVLVLCILLAWIVSGQLWVLFLGAAAGVLYAVLLALYRKLSYTTYWQEQYYRQLSALVSVYAVVAPTMPLPDFGDYAIAPDLAKLVVSAVRANKPRLVVELGSGVSTLLVGYCLKQIGGGRIISLDQSRTYAQATLEQLRLHDLLDYAAVHVAELEPVELNGRVYSWYAMGQIRDLEDIDLLIIDGPSGGPDIRYPALPVLFSKLSPGAVIFVDDTNFPGVKAVLVKWEQQYPSLAIERYRTAKGTAILRKNLE